ncbi:hypothetical protein QJS10_CPB04g00955 [Acorus calamus]|uniref:Endosulphine n=1 Tax=Acorus calamus TaxID=4465 RepID=A0AAV9F2X1_ACOCL|nr:hypothetical protein QJS10_CPB04g00955 [Acorus calamus]
MSTADSLPGPRNVQARQGILKSPSLDRTYLCALGRQTSTLTGKGEQDMAGCRREEIVSKEEAPSMEKKYGGIAPKKKPLISKDHERAFFDSADWALGKQDGALGQKSKASVETLQPKLQE